MAFWNSLLLMTFHVYFSLDDIEVVDRRRSHLLDTALSIYPTSMRISDDALNRSLFFKVTVPADTKENL